MLFTKFENYILFLGQRSLNAIKRSLNIKELYIFGARNPLKKKTNSLQLRYLTVFFITKICIDMFFIMMMYKIILFLNWKNAVPFLQS